MTDIDPAEVATQITGCQEGSGLKADYCAAHSYAFGVMGYPPEKQAWARIAFAAPLWPLIPLLLTILMVQRVIGGKS